ncbi:MAG TPA: LysM domain-containing protein [Myxococcota bacterium]|nr:LysM domain-containing protein [Myxococcota bacterium]
MIAWWIAGALAGVHVVGAGETVESIAERLGAAGREVEVRRMNGLGPGEQPPIGTVLELPDDVALGVCQPSYLRAFSGQGSVLRPGAAAAEPLVRRATLPVGAVVCTGPGSFATVSLSIDLEGEGRDDVTLMPETCVTVRGSYAVAGGRTSVLSLGQGELSVREAPAGQVVVQTTAGVTLGDDGGFRVAREPASTRTEAVGAQVTTFAQGQQVQLPEGYGGRTREGEPPGPAVELPPAGHLVRPADGSVLVRPDFAWTVADNVLGYFVEIAATADFSELLWKQRVAIELWEPRSLALPALPGGVFWRVTSFDRAGFEGAPSEAWWLALPSGGR